jgi:hypothetical protein
MSAPVDGRADSKPGAVDADRVAPGSETDGGDSSGEEAIEAEPAPAKLEIGGYAHFDSWVSEGGGRHFLDEMAALSDPEGSDKATQQQTQAEYTNFLTTACESVKATANLLAKEQQPLWKFSPNPGWGAGGWRCVTVPDAREKVRQLVSVQKWQDRDLIEYWEKTQVKWLLYEKGHELGFAMHAYAYYMYKHREECTLPAWFRTMAAGVPSLRGQATDHKASVMSGIAKTLRHQWGRTRFSYLHFIHLLLPNAPLAGWTVEQFKKELLAVCPEFALESQWSFKQLANIATRVSGQSMAAIHECQSELQVTNCFPQTWWRQTSLLLEPSERKRGAVAFAPPAVQCLTATSLC